MTGRATPDHVRYPPDPWCWGFCTGWLIMWRLFRLVGIDLDEATR